METSNCQLISEKSQQIHTESNKKLIKKQANILFHFDDDSDDNEDQIQIQDLTKNEFQNNLNKKQNISGKLQQAAPQKNINKNSKTFFKQQSSQVRNQSPAKIIQMKSQVISISPSRFKKKKQLQQEQISSLQSEEKSDYIIVQKQNSENRENKIMMDESSYNIYPQCNETSFSKNQLSQARLFSQLKEYSDTMSPQKQQSPDKLFMRFHSKNLNQDILKPNQKELQASQIYAKVVFQKLKDQSNKQKVMGIHKFTSQPLEGTYPTDYVRFLFEIHIYKYYFSTDYQLWLRNSEGELIKLLKAQKDPLGYRSSCLMLYQVSQTQKHQKVFTGKLNYNITKNQYHLYDIDQITYPEKPRQMLATIFYTSPYTNVQRKIQLIVPKRQYYDHDFIRTQSKRNLLDFKETQKIQQLKFHKILPQQLDSLKEEFQLKKSERILCLEDDKKRKKLFIGKIQANRYIMIVGKGITPLQAFATAIANFQH